MNEENLHKEIEEERKQLKEDLDKKDKELNKLLCPEQEDGEYLMSIPDSLARFDVLNSYPEEFKEETEAALNKIKDNLKILGGLL